MEQRYQYNNRDDRTSRTIDADGQLRQRSRFVDRDQRTISNTDAENNQSTRYYDGLERLIKLTH